MFGESIVFSSSSISSLDRSTYYRRISQVDGRETGCKRLLHQVIENMWITHTTPEGESPPIAIDLGFINIAESWHHHTFTVLAFAELQKMYVGKLRQKRVQGPYIFNETSTAALRLRLRGHAWSRFNYRKRGRVRTRRKVVLRHTRI